MKRLFLAFAFLTGGPAWGSEPATLTVLTYGSFASEWGPGAAIAKAFETDCACALAWVTVDDAGAMLARLKMEGASSEIDVVLGLDTSLMAEARATGLFAPHDLTLPPLTLPIAWDDATFVPFDFGYFAVIYDAEALATPPTSLRDLVEGNPDQKIVIQDPRTSTPGLGLLLWVRSVYGAGAAEAWRRLRGRVLTVTQGWSEAYGLFLAGEAPMVLSYTTSPAYHRIIEGTDRYRTAPFAEGHYLQVEIAGMLASSDVPELAAAFLAFVPSTAFQQTIPTGNWMYPVIDLGPALPPDFAALPTPAAALLHAPDEVAANREAWIAEWLAAMSE